MAPPARNPKDSMKSTWRLWDRSQWNFGHWLMEVLDVHPLVLGKEVPVHQKTEKVPNAPELQFHIWILAHAIIPLALHQLYVDYFGKNLAPWMAFIFYHVAFQTIAIHEVHVIRRMGHRIGFFDGDKHPRDEVPDVGVSSLVQSVLSVVIIRPMFSVFFAYNAAKPPSSISWVWAFVETGVYAVTLDFWYYGFHRLAHESDHLWRFHRTHHLTKHPSPLLTAYVGKIQEVFDVAGAPLLAYGAMKLVGFPMGFYEWWICQAYVTFTEVLGHSGLRMQVTAQNPWAWLLRLCGMELMLEDHDLHHRRGWKSSYNYGKQTRVWDRLFGTTLSRVEGHPDNIDYVNTVKVPLI